MASCRQRFVSLAFALFIVYASETNAAIKPPQFVYRADFRSPDEIFANGMKPVGDNVNLLDHVSGLSCSYGAKADSAFVATSSEESFALKWGSDQIYIDLNRGKYVYIYKIRATENFYSAYDSLMHAYKKTNEKFYKVAAKTFEYQKEWLAHRGVPTELIVSADVMEKDLSSTDPAARLQLKEVRKNNRYVEANSQGNAKPFPAPGEDSASSSSGKVSLLASRLPFLSSCFGSCPSRVRSDAPSARLDGAPGRSCPTKQLVFESSLTANTATVWDPLNKVPTERIVPWKEETTNRGRHAVEKPSDCTVVPGTSGSGHPLQITCPENRFYDSFVVLLKAGIGPETIVDTTFKDGITRNLWKKAAFRIPLAHGKGTLQDHKVSIAKVFYKLTTDTDSWWSVIRIYPVYPDYIQTKA